MIWSKNSVYTEFPFEFESDLEKAINECKESLFGKRRIYFDVKKKIGVKGKTNNIPDGYLLDLSENKPRIFVVENELSRHHIVKHIAVQILEFSLSFTSSKLKIKKILREEIMASNEYSKLINEYVSRYGFDNVDNLLNTVFDIDGDFNALLIIDEYDEELENILEEKFNFDVETIVFRRYKNKNNEVLYDFNTLDEEIEFEEVVSNIDEVDTIIVPAREDGFNEVFLGEDCWYSIRINSNMLSKIKYIAAYQVSPISAITHIAKVESIEKYENTNKYILYFCEAASKIGPVVLGKNKGKAPQSPRYSSFKQIESAKTIDDIF